MPRLRLTIAVALLAVSAACVHRAAQGGDGNPNLITRDQIDGAGIVTAYDLILRYRPMFLRDRGKLSVVTGASDVPVVFLGSVEYGPIASLRTVSASTLDAVRFYPGPDAVTRFGARYGGGVIQLVPRSE